MGPRCIYKAYVNEGSFSGVHHVYYPARYTSSIMAPAPSNQSGTRETRKDKKTSSTEVLPGCSTARSPSPSERRKMQMDSPRHRPAYSPNSPSNGASTRQDYQFYSTPSPETLTISDNEDEEEEEEKTPQGNTAYPIIIEEVDFMAKFANDSCIIAVAGNTASCIAYGISAKIQSAFKYGNVYSNRRPLFTLTRARTSDRGTLGAVHIRRDKNISRRHVKGPHIAYLMVMYAPGPAQDTLKEELRFKPKPNSKDLHYNEGMMKDTSNNRSFYLRECLQKLLKNCEKSPRVRKIIFPKEHTWGDDFMQLIQDFASRVLKLGIRVYVTHRPPHAERKTRDEESGDEYSDPEEDENYNADSTSPKSPEHETASDFEDAQHQSSDVDLSIYEPPRKSSKRPRL